MSIFNFWKHKTDAETLDLRMDKEQFYKEIEPFFDEKLMYEVYSTDELVICNLANACYVVFSSINTKAGHCGILVTKREASQIAENNSNFGAILKSIKKKDLIKNILVLNEENLKATRKIKEKYAQEGVISDINYELEAKLREMSPLPLHGKECERQGE